MATSQTHYETLLAPIYLWMVGGWDSALAQGERDLAPWTGTESAGRTAIDLGAGFGLHTVPLARSGYAVTAFDTSATLLNELQTQVAGLKVRIVQADLLDFRAHVATPADLILCMGDTLTHLADAAQVERLCVEIAAGLARGGRAVFTFRDYTHALTGDARFIPVRSDADRIHTCFLEEAGDHLRVHDLVHERQGAAWTLRVSSYLKIRLAPAWVAQVLERAGLRAVVEKAPRGMVRVVAEAP